MRVRTLFSAGLVSLVLPSVALAADPIMPLSEVQIGMQCTGYSVFKGTAVETFDVEIVDVVGEAAIGATPPALLVKVSGERIDPTGVGPGFSGSPVYCPGADGVAKNAGAIAATIGDYGGKTVLATPIEAIIGTPIPALRTASISRRQALRDARLLARAKPLATPISVGGLSAPTMNALTAAARRHDVTLTQAPSIPADRTPEVPFVPGSAVGVGISSGDVTLSGIGTVSYVDGDKLWAFGHPFDGAGRRSLLLQDAYIATIINNPVQAEGISTYKLGGAVRDRGTISYDGLYAVAGTLGQLPPRTNVRVVAADDDTGRRQVVDVDIADEADVDNPTGYTGLSFAAPLAVQDAATTVLGAAPQRLAGRMCMRVVVEEIRRPLRFCNRYVSDGTGFGESVGFNPLASAASTDAVTALSVFEAYKGDPVHVRSVDARITQTRAQRQAYIRNVFLPRRVHRGDTVPVKLTARVVRGQVRVFKFRWKVPTTLKLGDRKLDFRGSEPDSAFGFFDELIIEFGGGGYFDSEGPRKVSQLADAFERVSRWDGIRVKRGGRLFRDETYRIAGRDKVRVEVLKPRG